MIRNQESIKNNGIFKISSAAVFEFLSFLSLKPSYTIPGFPWFVLKCSILKIENKKVKQTVLIKA